MKPRIRSIPDAALTPAHRALYERHRGGILRFLTERKAAPDKTLFVVCDLASSFGGAFAKAGILPVAERKSIVVPMAVDAAASVLGTLPEELAQDFDERPKGATVVLLLDEADRPGLLFPRLTLDLFRLQ